MGVVPSLDCQLMGELMTSEIIQENKQWRGSKRASPGFPYKAKCPSSQSDEIDKAVLQEAAVVAG